jgi:hypothetical protein
MKTFTFAELYHCIADLSCFKRTLKVGTQQRRAP